MKIACVLLASGQSKRFKTAGSKLFYKVYGTPIVEYTLKNIAKHINKKSIYITIPKKITKKETNIISKYTANNLILGGKDRIDSVKNAIKKINLERFDYIMIHDGARPLLSHKLIKNILTEVRTNKYDCVLPASQVEDTIRKNFKTLERKNYYLFQTPQIFKSKVFLKGIKKLNGKPTDDYGIIENEKNLKIKLIEYDKQNIKITKYSDVEIFKNQITQNVKYGNGFDIHKLRDGKYLSLGGLKIKSKYESIGHSDGDVVLHALIDSVLGSTKYGDIGQYFPALRKYKNIQSEYLLDEIKSKINFKNIIIQNIDCTIICQKIRLERYKNKIAANLSKLLECDVNCINIKAKTADGIGLIGQSKAIACWITTKLIEI